MKAIKTALSVAGSDSGGGAGIQADLKTFTALGVHGATAITAITAQNTLGVRAVHPLAGAVVAEQMDAVLDDFDVVAVKIGMLATAEIAAAVAATLAKRAPRPFIVYDPVINASSGHALGSAGLIEALAGLLPLIDCLTPNLMEAAALLGEAQATSESDMLRQGLALLEFGPRAVLMKGGHLDGHESVDWLIARGETHRLAAPRLSGRNLHGTGCTLSSALAAHVVRGGDLVHAARRAKDFVTIAIDQGGLFRLGAGNGPVLQTMLRRV